jgi:hypothetical protein
MDKFRTPARPRSPSIIFILLVTAAVVPPLLFAEAAAAAAPANRGFVTVKQILVDNCSACHDWTGSWETVTAGGRTVPGSPDTSLLYQRIASDEMPATGDKLTAEQKAFIRGWIAAGAPSTDLPISVPAAETSVGAATAAEETKAPPPSQRFLFFPSKVVFHEVTGFTSTALFAAAGVIGVVHFFDMMNEGHRLRELNNFTEGSPESLRIPLLQQAWGSDSALRWWHVGLLIGGETLYLGDAITGISMMTKRTPGKFTKRDLHRLAFFTHASLMAAQVVLGFFTTDALSRGAHDAIIALGAAHAAIGVAIPVVMLGAGLSNIFLPE